ncbi:MAG: PEGA domain-containing protein [Bacteroidales bacterium]
MFRKLIALGLLLMTAPLYFGCATLLAPKTHPLSIASEPQGAQVFVNGVNMGTTPVQLNLKADQNYTIEFRKEGYEIQNHIVNSQVGAGWVIVDVLFGIVPVVVDAATGAWNKLDQESVEAVLYRQNQ